MRMLSAFKPDDSVYPTLLLSTHQEKGSVPISEIMFVESKDVESALALVLDPRSEKEKYTSGWIEVQRHPDTESALEWGRRMAETLQFIERRQQGTEVYMGFYNQHCPKFLGPNTPRSGK